LLVDYEEDDGRPPLNGGEEEAEEGISQSVACFACLK
jgi:hypothetical protein